MEQTTTVDANARHHNQRCGALGEELAAAYLITHGYKIVERNWRSRSGELDIIARDGTVVVAVEVKTRTGQKYGHPLEAVTTRKARRLRKLLLEWRRTHEGARCRLRIDAIGVTLHRDAPPTIEHLQGIS